MAIQWIDDFASDPQATLGKFVIIEHEERFVLIRSSMRVCEYHAQIVARFAQNAGLEALLNADKSDLLRVPPEIRIHGGGYWELQPDQRVRLFAKSSAFGRFDEGLLLGLRSQTSWQWYIEPL